MPQGLANLGDLFPDKELRCRVRGCPNLIRFGADETMSKAVKGELDRKHMCEECRQLLKELEDREVACVNPNCSGTWTWTRYQQLEAKRRGFDSPPRRLCKACLEKADELEDREVPCRVRACKNTWTWAARDQARAGEGPPPERMCESCYERMKPLRDRDMPCRMRGCENTWRWTRFHQLEHLAQGKSLEVPPARMCPNCFRRMKDLPDRELPCKADECQRTWRWTAYAQVEHERQNGPDADPPSKLCPDCYRFFRQTRERGIRCRNRGCRNTWTYTRGMQLHDWLQGQSAPSPRMCEECSKRLDAAEPREIACMVPGCERTWTYSAVEQVRDQAQGKAEPTPRRCDRCNEFLAARKQVTLECAKCGADIVLSVYEQLLIALHSFSQPTLCSACAGRRIAGDEEKRVPTVQDHHHVVRMPKRGKWASDPKIAAWPPHMTHEVVHEMESADVRIVAFGDELVHSRESTEETWPLRLQQLLAESLGRSVCVLNAGIPNSDSQQGTVRVPRDVAPFRPHLLLLSFTMGDARVPLDPRNGTCHPCLCETHPDSLGHLLEAVKPHAGACLYAVLNPVFPHTRTETETGGMSRKWATAQEHAANQCRAHHVHICHQNNLPVADLRAKFEVNGMRSARKWMADWVLHNRQGAENIAVWLRDRIMREELLPPLVDEPLDPEPLNPALR